MLFLPNVYLCVHTQLTMFFPGAGTGFDWMRPEKVLANPLLSTELSGMLVG